MIFLKSFMELGIMERRNNLIMFSFYMMLVIFSFIFLFVGSYKIKPDIVVKIIFEKITTGKTSFEVESDILLNVRLPRILLAVSVGTGLSISSACFQSIFRNPLVSEYILGVSSGAAFGASLSVMLGLSAIMFQLCAFTGGILAVILTYFIAKVRKEVTTVSLVLAGITTTAIFTAANYIIRYIVEPEKLQIIVAWIMGSFSSTSWRDVILSVPLVIVGCCILYFLRWQLNIISMGDEEAKALGSDVKKIKMLVIAISTLVTSSAVAPVGIIGWIGLIAPHIVRIIFGSNNLVVVPLSGVVGGILLLTSDTIVRSFMKFELPVGIVTTLIGAPFFAYLLRKTKIFSIE